MFDYQIRRPCGVDRVEYLKFLTEPGRIFLDDAGEVFAVAGLYSDPQAPMQPKVQVVSLTKLQEADELMDDAILFVGLDDFREGMDAIVLHPTKGRVPLHAATMEQVALDRGLVQLPRAGAESILERLVPVPYIGLPRGRAFSFEERIDLTGGDVFFPICLVETLRGPAIAGIAGVERPAGGVDQMHFTHLPIGLIADAEIFFGRSELDRATQVMVDFWLQRSTPAIVGSYIGNRQTFGGLLVYPEALFDNHSDIQQHFEIAPQDEDLEHETRYTLSLLFGHNSDLLFKATLPRRMSLRPQAVG